MSRLLVLGATGSLGRHVLRQALDAGHEVTVFARTPSKLAPADADRVALRAGDLRSEPPLHVLRGQEVLINCAGNVSDGEAFVALVDRVVTAVDRLPAAEQPVCWFLAGVAILEIDECGRRGVDLPTVRPTYWPHEKNFERLKRSHLDWRLLCPGPMVDEPPLGVEHLRISLDILPVDVPGSTALTDLAAVAPAFASLIPQMIVSYADSAAVMLANLHRGDAMSRHRVGLALPVGMRGQKSRWMAARPTV